MIDLPMSVLKVIERLNQNNEEAYLVGGSVRDFILNHTPHDFDVATSALPSTIQALFQDVPVIDVGIAFGTLIIVMDQMPIEVTTFRHESKYHKRKPTQVSFQTTLKEDLRRRDFTINAIAYHPKVGLIDPFNGIGDIQIGLIKTVDQPIIRFQEDPLRILRALRFQSKLGFDIEKNTMQACLELRHLLDTISVERIYKELCGILEGDFAFDVLMQHQVLMTTIMDELKPMIGFNQHNPNHCFDVYEHTIHVLKNTPKDRVLRLTALFHDLGKPYTLTIDKQGIGHFYGHQEVSVSMARHIFNRLHVDNQTKDDVLVLIKYHDVQLENTPRCIKRWLNKLGEHLFMKLLLFKQADIRGQHPNVQYRWDYIEAIKLETQVILDHQACFSLNDLKINGHDLVKLGYVGQQIGLILKDALDQVINEQLENNQNELLIWVKNKYPL